MILTDKEIRMRAILMRTFSRITDLQSLMVDKKLINIINKESGVKSDEDYDCIECFDKKELIPSVGNETIEKYFEQEKRILKKPLAINVHCSGSPLTTTIAGMKAWWRSIGWINDGYNKVIKPDGSIVNLSHLNNTTNGVKGYNSGRWNICIIGGTKPDGKTIDNNFTKESKETFQYFLDVSKTYVGKVPLRPHNSYKGVIKACPVLIVGDEFNY